MEDMLGFYITFLFIVGIAAIIGGIIYFIMKLRAGETVTVSLRFLFTAYLYLASIVGLLVLVNGLALLLNFSFSVPLGKEFSYKAEPVYYSTPVGEPAKPVTQLTVEERTKLLDIASKEGILSGFINLFFGALIWGVHVVLRKLLLAKEEVRGSLLNKAYLIILLLIFGSGSVVNLPSGTFDTLRYYVVERIQDLTYVNPPGPKLSSAIVFIPIWFYYLFATIREVRRSE